MQAKIISIISLNLHLQYFHRQLEAETGSNVLKAARAEEITRECVHQLANAILSVCKDFEYEIWQPDATLDGKCVFDFDNGLKHKLFPANIKKCFYGTTVKEEVLSPELIKELDAIDKTSHLVIHLHGEFTSINRMILERLKNVPVIYTLHGGNSFPDEKIFIPTKNILSKLNLLAEHLWLRRNLGKVSFFTYQTDKDLKSLKLLYKGESKKITMGCDFSVFHKLDKQRCRAELSLPPDIFTMVTVSIFRNGKQIDKFIKVLTKLTEKHQFLYIVIGHGEKKYEEYLKKQAAHLFDKGMVLFPGYVGGENLVKYLNCADLFVLTSSSEGGPVSTVEAFACELPVFSTKVGQTSELMEKEKSGCLVEIKNYKDWEEKLSLIMETGTLPPVLDRNIAQKHYDWSHVAEKFVKAYKYLSDFRAEKGIEITTNIGCKNLCSYCPQDAIVRAYAKRSDTRQMSFETFQACLNNIPSDVMLIFSGMSEPWFNSDIGKMLMHSSQKGYQITLITTLVGMKTQDVDLLVSLKSLKEIHIHLPSAEKKERIEVDANYLQVLDKLSNSGIKIIYRTHGQIHPALDGLVSKEYGYSGSTTRAGNVKTSQPPKAKRGKIKCGHSLTRPVLLPNGDVVLCCMDFGMKHLLGNLLSSDYESLFNSSEFLKIKAGLEGGSADILCRYCEYAYSVNLFARFYNTLISCIQRKGIIAFLKLDIMKLAKSLRRMIIKFRGNTP